ncbi:hypothetical protein V2G26_002050 [Clonostachys chloroleuca]
MEALPLNLCELFAQAVARCPDNLAVDHSEGCLTYRELEDAANSLASTLRGAGVCHQSPVILLTAHGTFNLIAILAILKAGGCWVPIDRATWSPEMVTNVCSTVDSTVIVNTTLEPFECPTEGWCLLECTSIPARLSLPTDHSYTDTIQPYDPACIVFTSGSTGRPKGVVISHRSLCLYAKTSPINLDITPGDRLLHILSVSFDACACILFSVLGNCGTVVPAQGDDIFLRAPSCTVLAATPSILNNLPSPSAEGSIFSNISKTILGGETAAPDLLGSWIDAGVRVLTAYGVTETTSMGSAHLVKRDSQTGIINSFLIGGVMKESPLYIVDSELGIIDEDYCEGEIIIGGDGVALGYYKDEVKTRTNFVDWNGSRIYRTGDFGCWVQDAAGNKLVEFRGRQDRTVKNRGFLVNLDRDVEACLYRVGESFGLTSVRAAMTENGIVAVVTPSDVNTSALIEKAKESMSSYCIPYRIRAVDDLPLSPNGKVQQRQLVDLVKSIEEVEDLREGNSSNESSFQELDTALPDDQRNLQLLLTVAREVLSLPGEKFRELEPDDSFLAVGGSSLLAFKIVSVIRQHNLHVPARELLKCQKFSDISALMSSISERACPDVTLAEKYAANRQIRTELASQARNAIGLAKNSFDIGPLTSLQLELAVSALGDETKNVNQVKIAYSDAHSEAMQRAWQTLWQSEPIFRSEVSLAFGCGAFIVHKKPFRMPQVTSHSCYNDYEKAVGNVSMGVGLGCTLDLIKYDASSDRPSLRSPSKPSELTVVLTVHHTLMDGESLKLLLDKLDRVAQGFPPLHSASTIDANLALLDIQRTRDLEVRGFFLDYLRNVPTEVTAPEQIPTIGQGSCMQSAIFETSVSTAEVASFATRNYASAACIYYVAWAMAIAAIEDCPTVIVGAVVSNRHALHRHDNAMGAYMSTLPLLFNFVDQELTIAELIRNTMDHLATIGEYAWARSDQVGIGHRMRNLLSIQFPLPDESSKVPALWTESVERNEFPLCLLIESSGGFRMLFNTMQYNEEAIQRLGQHFKHALYSLHHETRVEDCITLNRLQEKLARQADLFRLRPSDRIAKQVLEEAMDRYADLIALEDCIGGKLTYRELDKFTNWIAHFIISTIPDTKVVALYADGTIGWILGLLGAVKAGCTYVNLDPRSTPTQRESVCKQCNAEALLLPNGSQAPHVPSIDSMKVFALDGILNDIAGNKNVGRQPNRASLDSPLVIVFTSGTTGTPKGFPISNRSLMAMKTNYGTTMFASPGRRIAQFMSPVFDVCNMEVFSALLHGATLVLRDPSDPYAHLHRVNTAAVTPSVLAAMNPDYFPNLEVVYACGEPVTAAIVKRYASRLLLYNAYGPAECSILIGIDRLISGDRITVGRPLKTIRVYVLDEQQQPVPRGARGELCMAGVQVLRDYVNAPEQAARNILSDPWHPGERMYRSGDAGSIGRDGRVNIYGRMDRLVKVRGFRVELAGVELAIVSGPPEEKISQCSTIVVNGLVVSFISFDRSQDDHDFDKEGRIARLRRRLCDLLPPSSVPQDIVPLDTFPRTNNGKIDTRALKSLYSNNKKFVSEEDSLEETSTSQLGIEQRLAYEWRQVLQLKPEMQIEESSNFFKMGGHSVSIMLLATRLTTAFGRRITVRELLPSPGFQQQVNIIKQLVKIEATRSTQPEIRSPLMIEELTEIEKQVWFQHQVATTVTAFNIVRVLKIGGAADIAKLSQSLNAVLTFDPIFRSNIVEGPNGPTRTLRSFAPTVREVDELDIQSILNHRFDLSRDPLFQVYIIGPSEGRSTPAVVILTSHVIADLGTLQNFLRLTSLAYSGSTLSPLHRPKHLDSNLWTTIPSAAERKFWMEYLEGHAYSAKREPLLKRLPAASPLVTFQGESRTREFKGELITAFNNLVRRIGATQHQLVLAITALLLHWFSLEDDFILGAPSAGRSTSEEQEALGQFLDRLPIRITPADLRITNNRDTTTSVVARVRDSSQRALSNAIPFSNIIQDLGFPRGSLQHPLFECMVTFHPRSAGLENFLQLPECNVSVSTPFPRGAKFPLMMEWFELGPDQWNLHIEHDTLDVPANTIDAMEEALAVILRGIADECSILELNKRLADLEPTSLDTLSSSSCSSRNSTETSSAHSESVGEIVSSIQLEMEASLGASPGTLSPHMSFFSAGADSQAVVSLRHRLQKLGFDIPLRSIFLAQSPVKLAEHLLLIPS